MILQKEEQSNWGYKKKFETFILTIIVRWEAKQTFLYDLISYISLKAKALTTKFLNLIAKI